jgi:hypothetical protein
LKEEPTLDEKDLRALIRAGIKIANTLYLEEVKNRGIENLDNHEEIAFVANEQMTLGEGLVWVWSEQMLPWLLDEFEIITVEEAMPFMLSCTCGLDKVGDPLIHKERKCDGVVLGQRLDLVTKNKETGNYSYHEFKTTAYADDSWAKTYEIDIQIGLGAAAIEKKYEYPVSHIYVHGLNKGAVKKEYDFKTRGYTGPLRQQSFLCYAQVSPGDPPLVKQDVKPRFVWKDEDGKSHRLTNDYKKTPLWQIEFEGKDPDISNSEHWVTSLSPHFKKGLTRLVGPIDNPSFLVDSLLREMVYEEDRWRDRLEQIEKTLASQEGDLVSTEYLEVLEEHVPRSWACIKYKRLCDKVPICFQHEGWQDPLGSDRYIRREPHHEFEKEVRRDVWPREED